MGVMVYNYYDCYCYCLLYVNESVECVELLIDKIRGDYRREKKPLKPSFAETSRERSPRFLFHSPQNTTPLLASSSRLPNSGEVWLGHHAVGLGVRPVQSRKKRLGHVA